MFANRGVDTPFAWLVVFSAFLCYAIGVGSFMGTTGIFFAVFLEEFQADRGATALMTALSSGVYLGCGIIAGWMTNHWGCRLVAILGSTCMGLAFAISSFSQSMTLIYFTQGLLKGLGTILMMQPLFVIVCNYHVKRLALAMSIVASGSGAGTAIFSSLSQYLINSIGWRAACRALGCIFFVLGSLGAMTFVPVSHNESSTIELSSPKTVRELLKIPGFQFFCMSIFLYGGFMSAFTTFFTDFAKSQDISAAGAAALWTYWGIGTAAGRLVGGLVDTTRTKQITNFSLALLGLGLVTWLIAFSFGDYPNYVALVFYQMINGYLMGMVYHLASLVLGDVLGVENVSLGMGVFFTAQMPLGVAAPPLLGLVADNADGNYTGTIQCMAVMQTLSGLLMYFFWRSGRNIIVERSLDGAFDNSDPRNICILENVGFYGESRLNIWTTRRMMTLRGSMFTAQLPDNSI